MGNLSVELDEGYYMAGWFFFSSRARVEFGDYSSKRKEVENIGEKD